MKTKWQFLFEYEDLSFERKYTYKAEISEQHAEAFGLPSQKFDALIEIEPEEVKHELIKQQGKIYITLPGDGEQTKNLAHSLVGGVAHNITFSQGKISVIGAFITSELLPETPEEIEAVGENRFSVFMKVVEVPPKRTFDSSSLQKVTANPLLTQFNKAKDANNPVDQFIGFFKILEDLYGAHPIKPALKNSAELREIAFEHLIITENGQKKAISQTEFESLIDDLVKIRHECAHLNSSTGFGITYGDSRVTTEVEPLLVPLRILAFEAVRKKIADV